MGRFCVCNRARSLLAFATPAQADEDLGLQSPRTEGSASTANDAAKPTERPGRWRMSKLSAFGESGQRPSRSACTGFSISLPVHQEGLDPAFPRNQASESSHSCLSRPSPPSSITRHDKIFEQRPPDDMEEKPGELLCMEPWPEQHPVAAVAGCLASQMRETVRWPMTAGTGIRKQVSRAFGRFRWGLKSSRRLSKVALAAWRSFDFLFTTKALHLKPPFVKFS